MSRRMKTAAQLLATIILATQSLTSCSDYDNGFDEATIRYNQNFRELFGNIDPNQDWNLVRQLAEKNGGGKDTRGIVTDDINSEANATAPNINMWITANYNTVKIPGYPDRYEIYHTEKNGVEYYLTEDELQALDNIEEYHPLGDVTDEEIIWVSEWFRTHYKPQSIKVHWENFFMQAISHDYDRVITYIKDPNDPEKQIPFSCNEGLIENKVHLYVNGVEEKTDETTHFPMNQLLLKTIDSGWQHLFNFNLSDERFCFFDDCEYAPGFESTKNKYSENTFPTDGKKLPRTIQLFLDTGTENFAYDCNADPNKYDDHVLVHLSFHIDQTETCKIHKDRDCLNLGHDYDGYYLGFDFQTKKIADDKIYIRECDGFYSNLILKLTYTPWKGDPDMTEDYDPDVIERGLLVCEDLGVGEEGADFDFNDVVLKLEHKKVPTENPATKEDKLFITAMAAGGTLPSYVYFVENDKTTETPIKGTDTTNEIHELLNGKAPNIINAGQKFGEEGVCWEHKIDDWNAETYNTGFVSQIFAESRIKIYVGEDKGSKVMQPLTHNNDGNFEDNVPQMMLLPIYYEWAQETRRIDLGYPDFHTWVEDATQRNWIFNQNEKETNITARNVSRPLPSTGSGVQTPILRAEWNLATIPDGGTIELPDDDEDIIFVNLYSNSNGDFSISYTQDKGVVAEIEKDENGKYRIKINKKEEKGDVTITVTQNAYGNYTSASISFTIKIIQGDRTGLRWRNTLLKSVDLIVNDPETYVDFATDDNYDPVELIKSTDANWLKAVLNVNDNNVALSATNMGSTTIKLKQKDNYTNDLTVTAYEYISGNNVEDGYTPAAVYYASDTECRVYATMFYTYTNGAWLQIDANGNEGNITMQSGDYWQQITPKKINGAYLLSTDDLKQCFTYPPLKIQGTGLNNCKVYIKAATLEDLYGTRVDDYTTDTGKPEGINRDDMSNGYTVTIPEDKLEEYDENSKIKITFLPTTTASGFNFVLYDMASTSELKSGNYPNATIEHEVSKQQLTGGIVLLTSVSLDNLQVFIKKADTSSAKKRTISRK